MKKYVVTLAMAAVFFTGTLFVVMAQAGEPDKFDQYRAAIKKEYGIDIKDYKGTIHGGRADGKDVIKYDLGELLMGIGVEQEHTRDKMTALEISMDHLEEFPDYYTRLHKMEKEAEHENESKRDGKKHRE
jgi:hypothetical protein